MYGLHANISPYFSFYLTFCILREVEHRNYISFQPKKSNSPEHLFVSVLFSSKWQLRQWWRKFYVLNRKIQVCLHGRFEISYFHRESAIQIQYHPLVLSTESYVMVVYGLMTWIMVTSLCTKILIFFWIFKSCYTTAPSNRLSYFTEQILKQFYSE